MAKILKNQTGSPISISDTGISLPASPATYTIPEQDYLLWAASANIQTQIASGNVVVNDGTQNLSIARGAAYVLYPDNAYNLKFITSTTMVSTNTRDAIEEAFAAATNFSYDTIIAAQTVTIPQYQQMIVYDACEIIDTGILNILGSLVIID